MCDQRGLRDSLSVANRQGMVFVSYIEILRWNKLVAGDSRKSTNDIFILQILNGNRVLDELLVSL